MSSRIESPALELDEISARLCRALDVLEGSAATAVLTPEQISDLLSELMQAGQCIREVRPESEEGLTNSISTYRIQVERLRNLLPSIHSALLRERARLAHEQERLHSISAWAQTSEQTR
jgi:hypothetical protein